MAKMKTLFYLLVSIGLVWLVKNTVFMSEEELDVLNYWNSAPNESTYIFYTDNFEKDTSMVLEYLHSNHPQYQNYEITFNDSVNCCVGLISVRLFNKRLLKNNEVRGATVKEFISDKVSGQTYSVTN